PPGEGACAGGLHEGQAARPARLASGIRKVQLAAERPPNRRGPRVSPQNNTRRGPVGTKHYSGAGQAPTGPGTQDKVTEMQDLSPTRSRRKPSLQGLLQTTHCILFQ